MTFIFRMPSLSRSTASQACLAQMLVSPLLPFSRPRLHSQPSHYQASGRSLRYTDACPCTRNLDGPEPSTDDKAIPSRAHTSRQARWLKFCICKLIHNPDVRALVSESAEAKRSDGFLPTHFCSCFQRMGFEFGTNMATSTEVISRNAWSFLVNERIDHSPIIWR